MVKKMNLNEVPEVPELGNTSDGAIIKETVSGTINDTQEISSIDKTETWKNILDTIDTNFEKISNILKTSNGNLKRVLGNTFVKLPLTEKGKDVLVRPDTVTSIVKESENETILYTGDNEYFIALSREEVLEKLHLVDRVEN